MEHFIGVDVVDLTQPRVAGRSSDERFLNRVFAPSERERIREADDPDLEVWQLWAAKEAAFKVLSKVQPELPVFHHARFRVTDRPGDPPGELVYEDHYVSLSVVAEEDYVLATAWNSIIGADQIVIDVAPVEDVLRHYGLGDDWEEWASSFFDDDELDPVHGIQSAGVRVMAKHAAASLLELPRSELRIVCPPGHTGLRPPYLFRGAERLPNADVSLSHDGPFIAAAVRVLR